MISPRTGETRHFTQNPALQFKACNALISSTIKPGPLSLRLNALRFEGAKGSPAHRVFLHAKREVLGKLQVEGVDFLGADVAGEQRNLAGSETGPRTAEELTRELPQFL